MKDFLRRQWNDFGMIGKANLVMMIGLPFCFLYAFGIEFSWW